MKSLKNKNIVLGVSSSIALYKSLELTRLLRKAGALVKVVMTKASTELVSPLTFETLSHNPVTVDLFHRDGEWEIEHISLARWADVMVIAPATANIIGKLARGIADDALTTLYLAYRGDVFVAPAMNADMYAHPVVEENLSRLRERGVTILEPQTGELACGEEGKGRLLEPSCIAETLSEYFSERASLAGIPFMVTAGPTRESIDDVRYISNPSTGKMGIAVAEEAARRGADVILILGPTIVPVEEDERITTIRVTGAEDMWREAQRHIEKSTVAVFAAAVSDYRPATKTKGKIKKTDAPERIELERTPDIALRCGTKKTEHQVFVGFAAESGDNIEEAQRKRKEKKFDLLLMNDISRKDTGFASDMNKVSLVRGENRVEHWEIMAKKDIATRLMDIIESLVPSRS